MSSKHFEIKIMVAYDSSSIPTNMKHHLEKRVMEAADRGCLLSDLADEAIVDEWDFEVKEQ